MDKVDLALVDWYAVLPRLGVDEVFLSYKKKEGPCPNCGGKNRFRFTNRNGKGDYFCNQCGSGDGVGLLIKVNSWDFKTAINAIKDLSITVKKSAIKVSQKVVKSNDQVLKENSEKLRKVWRESVPIVEGDPAWIYLNSRVPGLTKLPSSKVIRFHKGLDYWDISTDSKGKDKYTKLGTFPALVSLVIKKDKPISIHRTFLTNDGQKANVPSVKKSMSAIDAMAGSYIKLFDIKDGILGVSEGIEKSLAINAIYMSKMPVWSLISATIMQNFVPPPSVKVLHIFGDNDDAGRKATSILKERALEMGIRVCMHFPRVAEKDFSDEWLDIYHKKLNKKAA